MEIEFERESLFQEVWQSPIRTIAKRYGLPEASIRKVCIALNVPLPGKGHWAKIAAAHPVPMPTLPPATGPTTTVCRPAVEVGTDIPRPKDDPMLVEWMAFEADRANAIEVDEVLLRPHPLVSAARHAVREEIARLEGSRTTRRRPPEPGETFEPALPAVTRRSWNDYIRRGHIMELNDEVLPMRVSIESSTRALRIWDAMIKACVARRMQLAVEPRALRVSRGNDVVRLRLSEKVDRTAAAPSARADQHQIRNATGTLRIFVIDRGETKFEDRLNCPLEHQLNDVLRRIHYCMASLRFQVHVWAEQRRLAEAARHPADLERAVTAKSTEHLEESERAPAAKCEALEHARQLEQQRENDLSIEANAWRQAETIRAYIAHRTQGMIATGEIANPAARAWLTWAAAVAEKLDPSSKPRQ